jgi:hypothetical protein
VLVFELNTFMMAGIATFTILASKLAMKAPMSVTKTGAIQPALPLRVCSLALFSVANLTVCLSLNSKVCYGSLHARQVIRKALL